MRFVRKKRWIIIFALVVVTVIGYHRSLSRLIENHVLLGLQKAVSIQSSKKEGQGVASKSIRTHTKSSGTVHSNLFGSLQTVRDPSSQLVLVNKENRLPSGYVPSDLVVPSVPFLYGARDAEFHLMRKVAALALARMFAAAKQDGVFMDGVSAYRSYATQASLFAQYVQQYGKLAAEQFSALPGESEHETGLAIDVSGSSGRCAVQSCFSKTPQAIWLQKHAATYGFIIRYPKGKQAITGYEYEPWHIRYVGILPAKYIVGHNITFEQYVAMMNGKTQPNSSL
ncbi:M15 family metallopeptidase [Ferroacidibacillus organovorans]|uniref:M15 family metallopeptidase n=1 Tax=Ferroacidibacillus organovorans TaxID=1765683 RepID=UPI000A7CE94A|nr:M15 family metallopeptidase [Ferroacidibacillus organovorans]